MRGQIGSWDEGLTLTLEPDGLEWLDSCNCDRRVLIDVDSLERSIIVLPDLSGHRVSRRSTQNAVLHGVTLDWRFVNSPPLPRFELMPFNLKLTEDIALEIKLPMDHLLPWPRLRDCARYSATEVACAEIERRMMSAALYYGPNLKPAYWSWTSPPKEIRGFIPRNFWADALRRATDAAKHASGCST